MSPLDAVTSAEGHRLVLHPSHPGHQVCGRQSTTTPPPPPTASITRPSSPGPSSQAWLHLRASTLDLRLFPAGCPSHQLRVLVVSSHGPVGRPAYRAGHRSTGRRGLLVTAMTSFLFAWHLGELPAPLICSFCWIRQRLCPSPWHWMVAGVGHGHGPLSGSPCAGDIVSTTVIQTKAVTEPSQKSLWK